VSATQPRPAMVATPAAVHARFRPATHIWSSRTSAACSSLGLPSPAMSNRASPSQASPDPNLHPRSKKLAACRGSA
jgi:hypothetical protein